MACDRFVNFKDEIPTIEQLKMILEDYLSGIGDIDCRDAAWFVTLPGKPSFPFRRLTNAAWQQGHDRRWFEVFVGFLHHATETHINCFTGEQYTLGPNIDVITRLGDEFTNCVASGFATLIARYFKADLMNINQGGRCLMLVISRKRGERVVIGNNGEIVLEIVEINGNRIRLGIAAPKDVMIFRQEIWNQMQDAKRKE